MKVQSFPPLQAVQCGNLRSCQQSSSEEVASGVHNAEDKYSEITEFRDVFAPFAHVTLVGTVQNGFPCKKKMIPTEALVREEHVPACLSGHSTGPPKAIFKNACSHSRCNKCLIVFRLP